MDKFNDFVANNYIIFAIASGVLLLALIGYFIEKKAQEKKLIKTEELKTINIQEQVNQGVNQNAQVETLEIQDAPAAPVQDTPAVPVQDANQTVQPTQEVTNQNVEQQPTAPAPEKSEENVEILG